MSRPASLWKRNGRHPFIQPKKKGGGQKLGIDWERANLSDNHRQNSQDNRERLIQLRLALINAEALGKYSAARRIRREINQVQEDELVITHTVCGGCLLHLHLCRCQVS